MWIKERRFTMAKRQDVSMIMAIPKVEYVKNSYEKIGVRIETPYKDYNILFRCLREAWFRLHLPYRKIWFNDRVKELSTDMIYIRDPLITPEFVGWVCDMFPEKRVVVVYANRASYATVLPTDIERDNLEFASYDEDDCRKYKMRFYSPKYMSMYRFEPEEKCQPEYDVVYLGRDKGRAKMLLSLQSKLEELGLKTYFHICASRTFMRYNHRYYKPEMKYTDYIELLKRTRSHLNIVPEGQKSITQREMESIFDQVKCITNNQGIIDFELYDPSRFFVLGIDPIENLPDFLRTEFKPVSESKLAQYEDTCHY